MCLACSHISTKAARKVTLRVAHQPSQDVYLTCPYLAWQHHHNASATASLYGGDALLCEMLRCHLAACPLGKENWSTATTRRKSLELLYTGLGLLTMPF